MPDVVEHEHALGCFLRYLAEVREIRTNWIFKGGTCLAKRHFDRYRFSEDLDFTSVKSVPPQDLVRLVDAAKVRAQEESGLRMDMRPTSIDVIDAAAGRESCEAKVFYEGTWRSKGSPRAIRIHANCGEVLVFRSVSKKVSHGYSDEERLPTTEIQASASEVIAAEKLRAFSCQRKFAVARDLYDLWSLKQSGIDLRSAVSAFPEKRRAKKPRR